jgi:hypothetical protein
MAALAGGLTASRIYSVRGRGEDSGGSAGLTDHATLDLNGTTAPLQVFSGDAGKGVKSLSLPSPPERSERGRRAGG